MISVHSEYDVKPWFRADPVSEQNTTQLSDICMYLSVTNYHYLSIAEATQLRDILTAGIDAATVAKQARYLKAVAVVAALTASGMGEVTE
jgi:hypothetical protein